MVSAIGSMSSEGLPILFAPSLGRASENDNCLGPAGGPECDPPIPESGGFCMTSGSHLRGKELCNSACHACPVLTRSRVLDSGFSLFVLPRLQFDIRGSRSQKWDLDDHFRRCVQACASFRQVCLGQGGLHVALRLSIFLASPG